MRKRELAFYLDPEGAQRRSIMKELADVGIRLIGTDGFSWDPDRDRDRIDNFRRDCAEFGLSVHSMHAVHPLLARADAETPPDLMEALERDLRRLVLLGGRTAVYHACLLRDVPEEKVEGAIDAAGWEAFAERTGRTIRRLAREAADAGITIVLENVWICRYSKSIEGIRRIIEAAEASNVGFILDSGHANLCGFSVADEIRRAGALLRDTHFHDNAGARVGVDQHIPPGLGTIDWQDACRALDEIAFAGPVVFEGVLGPGDSIEKGRFGGKLSHKDLIHITLNNWRAFEALAEQKSPRGVS